MISDSELQAQLARVITGTEFSNLGEQYHGKVRDNYTRGQTRIIVTTDRLSCFDVVVTTVPFKGQVLNQLATYWFEKTDDIVTNHLVDVPDPNVMVVKLCEVLPIEVVVRAYLTGSAWRDYESGKAISGIRLPEGLKASQKLAHPILTPSTKAALGSHDTPISEEEIISTGLVSAALWEEIREVSLALFSYASKEVAQRGLLLVDTKYEFGLLNGKLTLVDEIHTLDSSRYWVASSYEERFNKGESPEMLDKEPTRQWLLAQGFKGDGPIPVFTDEHRVSLSKHYINSFERISGKSFSPARGDATARITSALARFAA